MTARYALPTAALLAAIAATPAMAEAPVRIGLLTCQVDGSGGNLISSTRELSCIFENVDGRPIERYAGEISRFGIDIGRTDYSDISWGVFSVATTNPLPGALEGSYAGISGSASIGVGLGANVLVGGLDRSFALQPVSLEATRGFNLALGVAQMELLHVGAFGSE